MALAHHRQKQPELVRDKLLAVVRDILVDQGPHAVTLDAVSTRAGVTKGGLQHHFHSKQDLLSALCDQLFKEFDERYQSALSVEPDSLGRHARAYIRACFDSGHDDNSGKTQRAIAQLALTLPMCRERWIAKMEIALASDGSNPDIADLLFIYRLAADGYWFSQMFDTYAVDEIRKGAILNRILDLCDLGLKGHL